MRVRVLVDISGKGLSISAHTNTVFMYILKPWWFRLVTLAFQENEPRGLFVQGQPAQFSKSLS